MKLADLVRLSLCFNVVMAGLSWVACVFGAGPIKAWFVALITIWLLASIAGLAAETQRDRGSE